MLVCSSTTSSDFWINLKMRRLVFHLFILVIAINLIEPQVDTEWNFIDFFWWNVMQRDMYVNNIWYNPSNITIYDVATSSDNRTFVALGRNLAVPVALATVVDQDFPPGQVLVPYPSWLSYEKPELCEGIVNVFNITIIDQCNTLWAVDNGFVGATSLCKPRLLGFDLKTNKLIKNETITVKEAQNSFIQGIESLIFEKFEKPCVKQYGYEEVFF